MTVTVTLSEAAYSTGSGTGVLDAGDFALTVAAGTQTLTSPTPSSITNDGGNVYTLGLPLTGTPAGQQLTVTAALNSIFDIAGNVSTATGGVSLPGPYAFASNASLPIAVNAWVDNSTTATDTYGPINTWNVSAITSMSQLFKDKTNFNSDISNWNTSLVENMSQMFLGAAAFNQNISTKTVNPGQANEYIAWNVSSVTTMGYMFRQATNFNQNIGNWDTSSVTTMNNMFYAAHAFNQNLNLWNVSSVTDMQALFQGAIGFNGDISAWITSSATTMSSMFDNAQAFNQDISNWNVSSVTNMSYMFRNAQVFNHSLKPWNVSSVQQGGFIGMFTNTQALSDENKNLTCGIHWKENAAWQESSFYYPFNSASGCDPYVVTLTGELYKLDNITGVCRMIQGIVKGKPFVINAMMKLDSENKERQMNEWSSKNAGGLETSNLEMQSFYTHVFVKHGDSECIVDFENGTVRGTPETDLIIKPISGKRSEIPMYNREVCSGGCSIQAGPVVVFAKVFPNRQVRSEIAICGGRAVKNADGFAVCPMRTKVCRVKKLTDGGMLTMKRSHYKGEVRERFYSTADKEGKVRTIPRV